MTAVRTFVRTVRAPRSKQRSSLVSSTVVARWKQEVWPQQARGKEAKPTSILRMLWCLWRQTIHWLLATIRSYSTCTIGRSDTAPMCQRAVVY